MINEFPKSRFISYLVNANKLNAIGFDRFLFFPGMMFGSKEKWWGAKGLRGYSHEGLDLCFFSNRHSEKFRLDERADIPMIYDGRVEHVTDDFLGKTIIASHCFDGSNHPSLLSLYGHLSPDKNLKPGDRVSEGQVFAKINGVGDKKRALPPHVHLSLAKPGMLPPADTLEWTFLNKVDRSVFIDPMDVIHCDYAVMAYDDKIHYSDMFSVWRKATASMG